MFTSQSAEQAMPKASTMAARRGFKGYGPGGRKRAGKAEVKEDHVLEELKGIYREYRKFNPFAFLPSVTYEFTLDLIRSSGIDYSPEDIEKFCFALEEFQHWKHFKITGIFLSALINGGRDEEYVIHTSHLSVKLDFVGYRNTKRALIEGDVGDVLGYEMKDGKIHVTGNVDMHAGKSMEGGKICVERDAGERIGQYMKGGKIYVKGRADKFVGEDMESGEICIEGDAGGEVGDHMKDGMVHVKGSVGADLGIHMEGGKIRIEGDAGNHVGLGMKGGEIRIEGELRGLAPYSSWLEKLWAKLRGRYYRCAEMKGGKIYHKGELIVDK